ncbi:MAG: lysylphosphatidylglycerol synthase transmembrane domain-containing protein [Bacteroidota bacterium]
MSKTLISVLKYSLGIGLGTLLLYLAFRQTSWADIERILTEVNYGWLTLSIFIGILSHFLRSLRWQLQLEATGHTPGTLTVFSSVMLTYLVNLAVPRAGEIARCTALYRTDKVPVATSLGTVIVERLFDAIILLGLIFLMFAIEYDTIYEYLNQVLAGGMLYVLGGLAVAGVVGLALLFLLRKQLLQVPLLAKAWAFVLNLLTSALSIRKLRSPGLFIFYTLAIYACYYLMSFTASFGFPDLVASGYSIAYLSLVVMVMGGIGIALPVPGGTGSYHAAVVLSFLALGVLPDEAATRDLGGAYAFALHTAQIIMMIVMGSLGYLYLMQQTPKEQAPGLTPSADIPE